MAHATNFYVDLEPVRSPETKQFRQLPQPSDHTCRIALFTSEIHSLQEPRQDVFSAD